MLPQYQALIILISLTLVSEIISQVLTYRIQNSCPPYHFFTPVQYLFFCIIYGYFIPKDSIRKYFSFITVPLLVSFAIINGIRFQNLLEVPSNLFLLNSLFVLLHILYTYILMMKNMSQQPLHKQGIFWFNGANLLYFASSFLYWAFYNILGNGNLIPQSIHITLMVVTISTYVLYGVSLWVAKTEVK